jgi:predicted methyltransferase
MGWQFPNGELLSFAQVEKINNEQNSCFLLINGELRKAEGFSPLTNRYYSLMPTPKAPTMLISGIPMHRIKDTTPDADTIQKIKALGKPFGKILDTATGLGYTATLAAKTADQVITIEFDPVVLKICRMNPWSGSLFNTTRIQQLIGDSSDLAPMFGDSTFSAIIHDPPMFNLAGHLYSQSLYDTFFRILKLKGRLFHYIGNPDSRMGATVGRGVVERLRKSGFSVTLQPRAFGVLARK